LKKPKHLSAKFYSQKTRLNKEKANQMKIKTKKKKLINLKLPNSKTMTRNATIVM